MIDEIKNPSSNDTTAVEIPVEETSIQVCEVQPAMVVEPVAEVSVKESVPIAPNLNVTLRSPVVRAYAIKEKDDRVNILNVSLTELNERPDIFDERVSGADLNLKWSASVQDALSHFYADSAFDDSLVRPTSDWRQGVEHKSRYITGGAPNIGDKGEGALLSGESARLRVMALSGLGAIVQIPLWHSGVWIKLKAPSDTDLMEMDRSIATAKTEFGRSTVGSIYSHEGVYINTILARFVLNHVYSSSLVDSSKENLLATIRATDIPTLVWGLACVVFANGYPLARPCMNDPKICTHIEEMILNIGKMSFTDNSMLLPEQREFMLNPEVKRKPDEITLYQSQIIDRLSETTVVFNDHVTVHLGVPSILEYETSGLRWIDSIIKMTETAATKPLVGNEREQYISDAAQLAKLRKFGHWITEISLSSGERITDVPSIEDTLNALSSNNSWEYEESDPDRLLNKIAAFTNKVTLSLIGIPRYECSACGALQTDEYQKHPEIIVVDVVKLFFTLVSLRLRSSLGRL